MNQVAIIGNVTRDLEIKYTPSGMAVMDISIAVNDGYGEKKRTSFIDVVAFGQTAELCNQYVLKGHKLGVEGKLQQDRWETKTGDKRSKIKIVANRVEFLTKKENDV